MIKLYNRIYWYFKCKKIDKNNENDFNLWNDFYKKYENIELLNNIEDLYILKKIKCEFKKASIIYWNHKINIESLSDIWCEFSDLSKSNKTYQDYFNTFLSRIEYSSDRMNYNRWLHAELAIAESFERAYLIYGSKIDRHELFDELNNIEMEILGKSD
jgi:hypothetical protein